MEERTQSWQPSLLGWSEKPSFDPSLGGLSRISLSDGAWVDHLPRCLGGHGVLFEHLVRATRWRHQHRMMYERVVEVPRLTASIPEDGPGHAVIDRIARALSLRYEVAFDRISMAWYRDGQDSVAWHGDRVLRDLNDDSLVGILSVGEPRRFLLRPQGGGRSRAFSLGWGDLLVMGGSCQRTWQHCVPKVARAGPRISVMFRCSAYSLVEQVVRSAA